MTTNNQKQYAELVKYRVEKEQEYIRALLFGVTNKQVQIDDGFSICPYYLLQEDTDAYKIAHTMHELVKNNKEVSALTVFDKIKELYPDFNVEKIAECAFSIHGNETAIKHLATQCRREAIKRKSEIELLECIAETQAYGGSLETISKKITKVQNYIDCVDENQNHYVGNIFNQIVENIMNGTTTKPTSTGFKRLDQVLKGGFSNGELIILGARPGQGKTAFAGSIAMNFAEQGKQVLFISREVQDTTLVQRMIARQARIDCRFFREGAGHLQGIIGNINRHAEYFNSLPLQIVEKSTVPMTPTEIRRIARGIKNIGLVVIDYLQLVNTEEKQKSREREIAEMSRAFKQLALDLNCPVLLLSQLNRSIEQADRKPQLSDLRESGAIEQDADIVMFIHTKKADQEQAVSYTEIVVAKGRSSGTGTAYFNFEKAFSDFVETQKRNEPIRGEQDSNYL